MSSVGVVYVVWGLRKHERTARAMERSVRSLRTHHPGIPITIRELPDGATLLDKAAMLDLSPYDLTLFLDADTVVMDDLSFGFRQAQRHHIACCICEAPCARRYRRAIRGDVVEYNTGVIFFDRSPQSRTVFDAWKRLARELDSSIDFRAGGSIRTMPVNDQAGFAAAVEETGINPAVLPHTWNFRPQWHKTGFGPIKVWHDWGEVPAFLIEHNARQGEGAVLDFFELITDAAAA